MEEFKISIIDYIGKYNDIILALSTIEINGDILNDIIICYNSEKIMLSYDYENIGFLIETMPYYHSLLIKILEILENYDEIIKDLTEIKE